MCAASAGISLPLSSVSLSPSLRPPPSPSPSPLSSPSPSPDPLSPPSASARSRDRRLSVAVYPTPLAHGVRRGAARTSPRSGGCVQGCVRNIETPCALCRSTKAAPPLVRRIHRRLLLYKLLAAQVAQYENVASLEFSIEMIPQTKMLRPEVGWSPRVT